MSLPAAPPSQPMAGVPVRAELEPLLAALFMMIDERRSVVIHVSAANAGEGTTTIAREIAAAAAASGWCKVALVDASGAASRPARRKERMPADALPGPNLLEAVDRGTDPVLQPSRIGSASVATGWIDGGQGAARLDSVRKLYGTLKAGYNLVVVDCPPVITGRQAAITASVADGTVLVVEAERTRVGDATRARDTLEQLGARVLGVVFNKRRRRIPRLLSRFF